MPLSNIQTDILRLLASHREADAFVRRMPTDKIGRLFLRDNLPVQPDPDHLDTYATHAGARRGHWPSSPEIDHAMLERYRTIPAHPPSKLSRP